MPAEQPDTQTAEQPVARRAWRRFGLGALSVLGVVLATGVVLYLFGGMSGSAFDPEIREEYERMVAANEVAPVDERFVIPIPGCTCHSDDPYRTQEHRNRRISECMGCHGR